MAGLFKLGAKVLPLSVDNIGKLHRCEQKGTKTGLLLPSLTMSQISVRLLLQLSPGRCQLLEGFGASPCVARVWGGSMDIKLPGCVWHIWYVKLPPQQPEHLLPTKHTEVVWYGGRRISVTGQRFVLLWKLSRAQLRTGDLYHFTVYPQACEPASFVSTKRAPQARRLWRELSGKKTLVKRSKVFAWKVAGNFAQWRWAQGPEIGTLGFCRAPSPLLTRDQKPSPV